MLSRPQSFSARKPLRSSPLAGPSLSYTNDGGLSVQPKPARAASTPDVPSLSRPSSAKHRESFRATQSEHAHVLTPGILVHAPSEDVAIPPSVVLKEGRGSDRRSQHRASVHFQPPISPKEPPTPTCTPTDSTWMAENTYQTTPRFSRLGLSAAGVVLPVSAKEHRRKSRPISSTTLNAHFQALELDKEATSRSAASRLHSHSMPSLIRTDSAGSSCRSSRESFMPLTPPGVNHSLPSLAESATIVTEEDTITTEHTIDTEHTSSHISVQTIDTPKREMEIGWKSTITLKTTKSLKDFKKATFSFLDTKPPPPPLPSTVKRAPTEPGLQRGGTVKRLLRAVSFKRSRN